MSEKPVAAASLGQMYKEVLRDSWKEVAMKVQRPEYERQRAKTCMSYKELQRCIKGDE